MNIESIAMKLCKNGDDIEHGAFYNNNTKEVVWESTKGTDESFFIPKNMRHKPENKDLIFIHNHPLSMVGSIMEFEPLSPADIFNAAFCNFKGVVATDGMNLYSVMKPKSGWGFIENLNVNEFDNKWQNVRERYMNQMKKQVKNLEITPEYYYTKGQVEILTILYKELFGINMKTVPLKNPIYYQKIDFWFIPPNEIPKWMKSSPKLMTYLDKQWNYAIEQLPELKDVVKGFKTKTPVKRQKRNVFKLDIEKMF